jgi:hypothetical protein
MNSPIDVFYDALGRGDVPSLMALLASDIVWTEAERFPYNAGTWRTPQQVVAFGAYAGTYKATGKAMRCACVPIGNARNGNPVM